MSPAIRLLALLAIVATVGSAYIWLNASDDDMATNIDRLHGKESYAPIPMREGALELRDSASCKECHPAIYAEWEASHHALAWVNPEPRRKELSDDFKNKDCIPCHAPRPMLEVGFGKRPLERGTRRDTGVDCFSCHKFENRIVGAGSLSPAAASAPCNPVTWEPFAEMTLCAPCHDQHKVHQNWKQSRFAVEGEGYRDCNDCHMPVADGPPTIGSARKSHKSHLFGGGNDPHTVRQAASLRIEPMLPSETRGASVARLSGREWTGPGHDEVPRGEGWFVIQVENTGAGHNFPDDERHRAGDLVLKFAPEGKLPDSGVRLARFRNPYRQEFELLNPFEGKGEEILEFDHEWNGSTITTAQLRLMPEHNPGRTIYYPKSTQLLAGESRFVWVRLPRQQAGRLIATLYYKKNPYLADDQAIVVKEITLDVDA
jgi:nitrate/TMAO reductase-like tetraheme cytochrome c subunit